MADIFNEIDEDLRRERLGKIWSRYGAYIIALAVLIVLGVGAWRGYEWWQSREAAASGARFAAALKLADDGKHAEAQAAFEEIARDGTSGYRMLARFRAAAELAYGDKAKAVAAYDALANENGIDPLARDVARIRAGLLLVDTAPLADIEARMKPLEEPTGAFRNSAREIIGLAQYRAGKYEDATKTFEALLADGELPPGMRQRAELMRTLSAAGAPPPASAAAPAAPSPILPLPTPTPLAPPAAETPTMPGAAPIPDASLGQTAPAAPSSPPASGMPAMPGASPIPDGSLTPPAPAAPSSPSVPDVAVPAPEPATPEAMPEGTPPADEASPSPSEPGPSNAEPAAPAPPEAPAAASPPAATPPAATPPAEASPQPAEPAPAPAAPAQPAPAAPAPAAPQ